MGPTQQPEPGYWRRVSHALFGPQTTAALIGIWSVVGTVAVIGGSLVLNIFWNDWTTFKTTLQRIDQRQAVMSEQMNGVTRETARVDEQSKQAARTLLDHELRLIRIELKP